MVDCSKVKSGDRLKIIRTRSTGYLSDAGGTLGMTIVVHEVEITTKIIWTKTISDSSVDRSHWYEDELGPACFLCDATKKIGDKGCPRCKE